MCGGDTERIKPMCGGRSGRKYTTDTSKDTSSRYLAVMSERQSDPPSLRKPIGCCARYCSRRRRRQISAVENLPDVPLSASRK